MALKNNIIDLAIDSNGVATKEEADKRYHERGVQEWDINPGLRIQDEVIYKVTPKPHSCYMCYAPKLGYADQARIYHKAIGKNKLE